MSQRFLAGVVCGLALGAATAQERRQAPRGKPGQFDYYVLALSWSPQYCAESGGAREPLQCGGGRRFGFVVHGLWPQRERGWPQYCSAETGPDRALQDALLDIMPSPRLIAHEWSRHGTCSGLDARRYFETLRRAFQAIRIPPEFDQPLRTVTFRPSGIKKRFVEVNQLAGEGALAVICSGRFLSEVRLCLDRNLKSRPCGRDASDNCRAAEIIVQPVR